MVTREREILRTQVSMGKVIPLRCWCSMDEYGKRYRMTEQERQGAENKGTILFYPIVQTVIIARLE